MPGGVRAIDEAREPGRVAKPSRRREQADRLVAPGVVQRMLVDRHQFDMGEAQIRDIGEQCVGDPIVGQEAARPRHGATTRDALRRSPSAVAADRRCRASRI